jgi:hypothetical protein
MQLTNKFFQFKFLVIFCMWRTSRVFFLEWSIHAKPTFVLFSDNKLVIFGWLIWCWIDDS